MSIKEVSENFNIKGVKGNYSIDELHNKKLYSKIFTRLTSNDNNWELPSPHKWKKDNQGKQNIAFENQYGFGHEEWLMNPRYNIKGFQYGFIRGLLSNRNSEKYDEVHLYTVKKVNADKLVYYVGFIKNVIPILNNDKEQKLISGTIDRFRKDMIIEVENINADVRGLNDFPFEADVKFKLEDVNFFEEPIYQPNFELKKYKRFQPYQFLDSITNVFDNVIEEFSTGFVAGKSNQTTCYNRKNKESSVTILRIHSEIVNALESFLSPTYSLSNKNLSIESTRFNGNIADVLTKEKDSSISIYEIKTSSSGRRNIRDAIAQLLDYALHSIERVNKICIVSPSFLSKSELDFLSGLKSKIDFELEYLCYQKDSKVKFISQ